MPVFGLDGGGTSTRLRIADSGNATIWEGRGPGINPNASSLAIAAERIRKIFTQAFAATGLKPADFAAGCAGVAGADRCDEKTWLESVLRDPFPVSDHPIPDRQANPTVPDSQSGPAGQTDRPGFSCPLVLTADPDIALAGALCSPEGMILIAGTGSVALARLRDGRRFKAGGLGHFLGDEGSAFWIAFQSIVRSLRSSEGRDLPTGMMPGLLAHFGLASPDRFIALVYREFDKSKIAGAAGLVERAREAGDPLARDIFDKAVGELVDLACSAHRAAGTELADRRLALWGGAFDNNVWLADRVGSGIASSIPGIQMEKAAESAAFGACLLALTAAKENHP